MRGQIKKDIIRILKKGEYSTSKIAFLLKRDYYYVLAWLGSLKKEGIVKNSTKGKYVYWSLK